MLVRTRLSGLLACVIAAVLIPAGSALAATYTVTTTTDTVSGAGSCVAGNCSLRQAIETADKAAGDVVVIPAGTYGLTYGELLVTKEMTIEGAGAGATAIDGGGSGRVLQIAPTGSPVTVARLAIRNGKVLGTEANQAKGGGILNAGTLTLEGVDVRGNFVGPADKTGTSPEGGGIFNSATLTIVRSTIIGNTATSAPEAGGIPAGGGIANTGVLSLSDSTLGGNEVRGVGIPLGGALRTLGSVPHGASVSLERVLVDGNNVTDPAASGIPSGGAISSVYSDVTIVDSSIRANFVAGGVLAYGGGIEALRGNFLLERSLIAGNSAEASAEAGGGGLDLEAGADDKILIVNSTIAENLTRSAAGSGRGGGIFAVKGQISLLASTVAANRTEGTKGMGGNLYGAGAEGSQLLLRDTIVAAGVAGEAGSENCFGPAIVSAGHNLDSGSKCLFASPGDITGVDPRLGPLADNGGPTQTLALLTGSPALDAGAECPPTDQRGVARPQGPACDIGAFEVEVVPVATPLGPLAPVAPGAKKNPAAASLTLLARKVEVDPKTGKGTLAAICGADAGDRCAVSLLLEFKFPKGKRANASAAAAKTKLTKIGSIAGTIGGGASGKLSVKMGRRGRALLAAGKGGLRVRAAGTSTGATGEKVTLAQRLKIVPRSRKP